MEQQNTPLVINGLPIHSLMSLVDEIEATGKVVFIFRATVEIRERIDRDSKLIANSWTQRTKIEALREALTMYDEKFSKILTKKFGR